MMAKYDYDIGILGGGAAGLTVASGATQLGAKTLLVEKKEKLGGDCLHFGCVPSKTLIRTAQAYHTIKNSQSFGLPPLEVPPVNFAKVKERIQSVIATIQKHDSEERFCSLGAKVMFGEPRFIDEHRIELNGENLSAKTWGVARPSKTTTGAWLKKKGSARSRCSWTRMKNPSGFRSWGLKRGSS